MSEFYRQWVQHDRDLSEQSAEESHRQRLRTCEECPALTRAIATATSESERSMAQAELYDHGATTHWDDDEWEPNYNPPAGGV